MTTSSTPAAIDAAAAPSSASCAEAALRYSRYAQRLLTANPDWAAVFASAATAAPTAASMRAMLPESYANEAGLRRALRELRNKVMLCVLARDLCGLDDVTQVTSSLSQLADLCLTQAQGFLHRELARVHGEPIGAESQRAQELMVVAMGKLGANELNASSDIDLVFVYPEDGQTNGARAISNHEFFILLARRLTAALSEMTADGYAFRVDARLRPYGESGALAVSLAMLEDYFFSQARPWERMAWIKARVVSGANAVELTSLVRPFVFRRYLDFGVLASLRELHAQIREEVTRRDRLNDVKLGPGGIREIEFIAQVFQLIRGGRDLALQAKPTLTILDALQRDGLLPAAASAELTTAYQFLRRLEHRLQYVEDAQTHRLPESEAELDLIAAAMGYARRADFVAALKDHRERVSNHFNAVFASARPQPRGATALLWIEHGDESAAMEHLAQLGFAEPSQTLGRLKSMRQSARYRQLPGRSRERMDILVPALLEIVAQKPNPGSTFSRMLDLLEAINRRETYLALLAEHPPVLEKLVELAARSPWAANYLRQHPILLDELLDAREHGAEPDATMVRRELDTALARASDDTEQQMDALRQFKQAQLFRLILLDLSGNLLLERLSDHLSDLADLLLERTLQLVWRALPRKHRSEPLFAVIGFGKLGGKELGYGSDLDIVFLHDDSAPEAQETYARLAQRINTWLNSFTSAGILYQTDLRLRPDGASGLLVSSLAAFHDYQQQHAWVWEHQALTRARFCAGSKEVGAKFEALRIAVLRKERELAQLRQEIIAMREKMLKEHRHNSAQFDVKSDAGGLIDVEFAVQFFVLGFSHRYAELTRNSGNIALLRACADLGLLPRAVAEDAANAYRELRRLQHQAWLNEEKHARVAPEIAARHAQAVRALWQTLLSIA